MGSENNFICGRDTYKCYSDVYGCAYNDVALRKDKSHSSVHDEKARFDEPYGQDLHLFDNQYELRAIDATIDLGSAEFRNVLSRFNEVTTCEHQLMHDGYQDSVCDLSTSVIAGIEACLDNHTMAISMR
jgi:hypothetical protein